MTESLMTLAPRRILAITGLGSAGETAVREGAARARACGAALAVVHAMPALDMVRPIFPDRLADDAIRQAMMPQQVREALSRHVAACAQDVPTWELFVETGGVADVALKVAERWATDLIVTGPPEDGAVDAERIVRHAHVPVLVARRGPARGAVIACTDFSDPSLPAVQAAAAEVRRTGERLYVIHALEPIPVAMIGVEGYGIVPSAEWQLARRLEAERRLARALTEIDVGGEYVAIDGPVVGSLVEAARERDARLLVIGTVGRTGLTRFLLGSVAEALVRDARCSTLVVRLAG